MIVIGFYLVVEAIMRFADPQPVDGWLVVIIAVVALVVDGVIAALTFAMSKNSVNIRAAFLHNLADALGSVAVIIAGTLILLYDFRLIDPVVTLLIAVYILWQSFAEIGEVIRILMLGSPPDIHLMDVVDTMRSIDGVTDVHHVHFWQMQEHENALGAHLVIEEARLSQVDAIREAVISKISADYEIGHFTLVTESLASCCDNATLIGDGNP